MNLIGREKLDAYRRNYASARKALNVWIEIIEKASWHSPHELKATLAAASIIGQGSDRVVFNIKGNAFRLVVRIDFARQIVLVRWFGTHAEYDRIDVLTV